MHQALECLICVMAGWRVMFSGGRARGISHLEGIRAHRPGQREQRALAVAHIVVEELDDAALVLYPSTMRAIRKRASRSQSSEGSMSPGA